MVFTKKKVPEQKKSLRTINFREMRAYENNF